MMASSYTNSTPHGGTDRLTGEYLHRLEAALELLGPEEAADTTAEIASYFAEAKADGALDSFLSTLGAPEALATGILAERGLLSTATPLLPVGGWRSAAAAIVDVVVALAPLAVAGPMVLVPLAPAVFTGGMTLAGALLALTAALVSVAAVAWAVHYWRSRRRGGRRQSVGMTLPGLRAVRAGGETRVVRTSHLRGARAAGPSRPVAALLFLVTLWLVAGVTYAFTYTYAQNAGRSPAAAVEAVAHDAGSAAGVASAVTAAVTEALAAGGADTEAPTDLFETRATVAFAGLLHTARENKARAYQITWVSKAVYERPAEPALSNATFDVELSEIGTLQRPMRFVVDKHVQVSEDGVSSVTWFRVSAIEVGEAFDPGD